MTSKRRKRKLEDRISDLEDDTADWEITITHHTVESFDDPDDAVGDFETITDSSWVTIRRAVDPDTDATGTDDTDNCDGGDA